MPKIKYIELDAIADKIVWLSRTSGIATLTEVVGRELPGGNRELAAWRSLYVELAYVARGQLLKGSFYCGPMQPDPDNTAAARDKTLEAAKKALGLERLIQEGMSKTARDHQLRVIGGGALFLHDLGTAWQAHPMQSIEAAVPVLCATCQKEIYFANEQWRHEASGRAEVQKDGIGFNNRPIKVLDHLASPDEVGKQL